MLVVDDELEALGAGDLDPLDVTLCRQVVDLRVDHEALAVVADAAVVVDVGDAPARLVDDLVLEEQRGDLAVDQRLVPLDLELDDVRFEDVVRHEVAERHLVVDAHAAEPDVGVVEPVTHPAGDLVLDRVPDGPPLHGAHRALGASLTEERLGDRAWAVLGAGDVGRPGEALLGVPPHQDGGVHRDGVLAVVLLAGAEQRVGERARGDHPVQVDPAGEVAVGGLLVGDPLQVAAEPAGLGLAPGGVAGVGVADRRPVAVQVHAVAVVALVEHPALGVVATRPAVGVGEDEEHDAVGERVPGGRAATLLVEGVEEPPGIVRCRALGGTVVDHVVTVLAGRPQGEVLSGPQPTLEPGPLDPVDRQRVDEVTPLGLRDLRPLVGHLQHVQVTPVAGQFLPRDPGGLEVLAGELRVVAVLRVQVDDLHVARVQLLEQLHPGQRLVPLDELRRADVTVRVRALRRCPRRDAAVRVGEDPSERRRGLLRGCGRGRLGRCRRDDR